MRSIVYRFTHKNNVVVLVLAVDNLLFSEYENDRRVVIESNPDGYETFGSKVMYLTLDNLKTKNSSHYQNIQHLTVNEKLENGTETIYLKPFN